MKYWRGRPYTCRKPKAQRDQGMRMLINDDEDEEDDEDLDAADDGDDEDDEGEGEGENEDGEGEDEDENDDDEGEDADEKEDDDPLPAENLRSGRDQGGIEPGPTRGGSTVTWKFQGFQRSWCLPIPC